ncbi:hypothetical protein [Alteromonas macleodii]|nr:hypothetical protein [Alteromonas macleodii]
MPFRNTDNMFDICFAICLEVSSSIGAVYLPPIERTISSSTDWG